MRLLPEVRKRLDSPKAGRPRTKQLADRYELLARLLRAGLVAEGLDPLRVLRDSCRLIHAGEFKAACAALDCLEDSKSQLLPWQRRLANSARRYVKAVASGIPKT